MKLGTYKRFAVLAILLVSFASSSFAQGTKNSGSLHGRVTDPSGAVVVGAAVSIASADGQTQKTVTDKQGNYTLAGISPGNVRVSATAVGFTTYEMPNVIIPAGQAQQLDIAFDIAVKQEQVTVQSESATVGVDPGSNASATVLKDKDLEALSDDPDELQQDLMALAGPSVGPNGGQIYIDGFSNGTLPPKSSIREIRINQNPFTAQYDRPGFGRVEVFTKPGTDSWHGQVAFNENNSVFNSRNPYVLTSVPAYHSERYNGNVGGALGKKMSVFLNIEQRDINESSVINANGFDESGAPNPTPITGATLTPQTRTSIGPRIDWQVAPGNTLTARYQFLRNEEQNQGVGGTTLATRGYSSHTLESQLQVSDTQVVSPHMINETRFQFIRNTNSQNGNDPGKVAIDVLGEESLGGSTTGHNWDHTNRYELQNYTSWSTGKHFVKFGGRLRVSQDTNQKDSNYYGTFSFSGTPAIPATATSAAVAAVTPLQAYYDGTPSQFTITQGNQQASLSFADAGLYAEDDWKLRPNLTLSYGVRFESQSSISDKADFAPRLGLSWGLGSSKSVPKTVLRVGYGIFYDRFSQDNVMQAERMNGSSTSQQQYLVTNPAGYPNNPCSASDCTTLAGSSPSIYEINPNLRAPYTMQAAFSVEQQLGKIGTLSVTYLNSRGVHQLIEENINAPLPGADGMPDDELRPLYATKKIDNVYQYNSEAIFKQNQLITSLQLRVSQKVSLMGFYSLGYANSNSNGASSSPSNQYNIKQDYGRAAFDVRNRLFLSGSLSLTHNIRISPFVMASSGAPFNITTGIDNNGDSFYNDRPAFGVAGAPGVVTKGHYGSFNPNPSPTDKLIPINYGNGPASVTVNMRVSKTIGFGQELKKAGDQSQSQAGGPDGGRGGGRGGPGGPPGGGFGGGHGGGGLFSNGTTSRRYNLTLTASARNLLNTVNSGQPNGSLSSSMFGKSNGLSGVSNAANRRFDLQATFSF